MQLQDGAKDEQSRRIFQPVAYSSTDILGVMRLDWTLRVDWLSLR